MTRSEWLMIYERLITPITDNGAAKHGADTWRDADNFSLQKRNNYRSVSAHCLDAYAGITEDHESGLDPRGHAIWRIAADYLRDMEVIQIGEDDAVYSEEGQSPITRYGSTQE